MTTRRILVVGDVMLDRYFWGHAARLSPEAPVPVVTVDRESLALGGAANVAANVIGLGCECLLVGVTGKDQEGADLRTLIAEMGITEYLVHESGRPTTTKTRVIAGSQHVVRLDREIWVQLYSKGRKKIEDKVMNHLNAVDAVIVSDYAKGVCEPYMLRNLMDQAREFEIPVFVDPKGLEWGNYSGAYCITPNYKEFCEYAGTNGFNSTSAVVKAALTMIKDLAIDYMIITKGGDGMIVVPAKGSHYHSKAQRIDVVDVSGAGDTVIAALATMKAQSPKVNLQRAADYANVAASVAVSRLGTAPVRGHELPGAANDKE
jgi:D-beta-D-heptose 7-phosphate kinase/D-beta-D-heptose 1-phosphate adenosyltransferase